MSNMSDMLVSNQLTTPTFVDGQMNQLNAIKSRGDFSVPNMLEVSPEPLNTIPTTQLPTSNVQYHSMDCFPTFTAPMRQKTLMSQYVDEQSSPMTNDVDMQQFTLSRKEPGKPPGAQPNLGSSNLSIPNKRKATTEPVHNNRNLQKLSAPNKRVTQMRSHAKIPSAAPVSAPNMKSMSNSSNSSATTRKVVQIEPVVNDHRLNVSKKNAQPQIPSKRQSESCDSVRVKLRESLASALALVQERQILLDGKMKTEKEASATAQEEVREQESLFTPSGTGASNGESLRNEDSRASSVSVPTGQSDDSQTSVGGCSKEMAGEPSHTDNLKGTDFESSSVLPNEDGLASGHYFKDEFLQGNGLSWVSEFDSHIQEVKEIESELMQKDSASCGEGKTRESPDSLAYRIELELFKLFGSVNKKYKEKGRSLLFNLKDRNNPELRERVMLGEIPPDRLCSMTAEELASKELSQWRIAKAEELDHMKVLPETDGNMRRLVKKTHKGEYQVDLDADVGASEDISFGISAPSQNRSKSDKSVTKTASKAEQAKAGQCELTIPSDSTDMQGLMMDDLKDLPPVISLDEFMESLDNEPPFENLPVDSVTMAKSDEEPKEFASKRSPVQSPKYPKQITSHKTEELGAESHKSNMDKKSTENHKGLETNSAFQLRKQECVWEGLVQLNLSSVADFMALFKSGEKASTKEWAGFFDIKGRVKLDAFDKFLQALPMSRSRAVMVCHFILKEGSDSACTSLKELVDSYIADERLGFAEPAPGVELYLCPPRSKTVDMIINHLPKNYTNKLNDIDDGLIAIVVWRKVQITSSVITTNSMSHPEHTTKKQTGSQHIENELNRNVRFVSRQSPPPRNISNPQLAADEDEDVPPGFGPPGSRDDDDLPEFKFSGGSKQIVTPFQNQNNIASQGVAPQHQIPAAARQVEQMRELIQKYGQNGNKADIGIPIEPWNDDDDDDIPEWQPQNSQLGQPTPPLQPVYSSVMQPRVMNHPPHMAHHVDLQNQPWLPVVQPIQPLQPPMRVQQGTRAPYGPSNVEGYYGARGPVYQRHNASNRRNS